MKKLILLSMVVCALSSCTFGLNDDTNRRLDAATTEIKRLNDEMARFEKDVQALTEALNKLSGFRSGRKENQ